MERGLLSDPRLAEFYDDAIWMYLFQDFSGSEADRAAQRVALRFGISAYPQHFLVDPYSLEVVADTGRSLASFSATVKGAKVGEAGALTHESLQKADTRAVALETGLTDERAIAALGDSDVVVRLLALRHLKNSKPEAIAANAEELLAVPNDHIRFLVCEVLADTGGAEHEESLVSLVRDPVGSKNPNVMRIRAVQALEKLGGGRAVEAIRPHAVSGAWLNGLTSASVDALAAIASRAPQHRAVVKEALIAAYPEPPQPDDERQDRFCRSLAERIHQALADLTGKSVPFPETYDATARSVLQKAW
jgi:HEAT repeat protein